MSYSIKNTDRSLLKITSVHDASARSTKVEYDLARLPKFSRNLRFYSLSFTVNWDWETTGRDLFVFWR